ncbi:hypothetical protein QUB70_22955 [Microcoleus sp. A003_D6]|uniref:hypothetical protein n=1 Tax=Microcoleus sp. A003_D6 TaxID=3055266 RepID=UPI002FD3E351
MRRKKEEGRRKKEEGRRKKEETMLLGPMPDSRFPIPHAFGPNAPCPYYGEWRF